jgi:hypothetical protein
VAISVPTTDPAVYPYAIVTKLRNGDEGEGYELHFLDTFVKSDWHEYADQLRASGRYDWVRLTTMNFMDEDTGELLGR